MRVLIVHELFPPDFAGGGETLVYNMAKQLQYRGHTVKVLTSGNPALTEHEGIPTIRLPRNRYLMNLAFKKIYQEAKDVDIIQTATYNAAFPAWLIGKLTGKPTVCLVMSFWGKRWQTLRGPVWGTLSHWGERLQIGRSYDHHVFISEFSRDFALQSGLRPKRSTVIYPGLDLAPYQPLKKTIDVLFSGRFAKQKGVYDVLAVAKQLPNVQFVMMGWGEEEKQLRTEAPANVTFSPLTGKDGKPFYEMYGKAKIFFLPSYAETFGFTIVEAAAAGAAIVSTVPLGFQGQLVNVGNTEHMVQAIQNLIDHPKERERMGKENSTLAQRFTWEKFTDQLVQLYDELRQTLREANNS